MNISFIKHDILFNNDPIIYWCYKNNIQKDKSCYFREYFSNVKNEIYKNILLKYSTLNVINMDNQKLSIKHLLKYNNYDIIYRPTITYKTYFESNDSIFIKVPNTNMYNIIIPLCKKKSNLNKKLLKYIASFYYTSLIDLNCINEIYFIPMSINYLDQSNWILTEYENITTYLDNLYNYITNDIINLVPGIDIFPNMKNVDDYPFHEYKSNLAKDCDEITQYYYCNTIHRDYYHKFNKNKNYSCKSFNIKNTKTSRYKLIHNILQQKDMTIFYKNNNKLKFNGIYIDFEIIPNIPTDVSNLNNIEFIGGIYNIGILIVKDNSDKFISLYSHDLNEKQLIDEYINILDKYKDLPIYHWTNAELIFLFQYEKKYNIHLHKYNYIDLHKNFMNLYCENPKILPGIKNLKLKNIIKSMNLDNNLYDSSMVDNGFDTINLFLKDYINKQTYNKEKIQLYNKHDCYYLSYIHNIFF